MKSAIALLGTLCAAALFASCNSPTTPAAGSTTGPIDGTYTDTATAGTCDTGSEGTGDLPATIVLAGSVYSYTHVQNSGDGCVETDAGPVTYSGSDGITITQTSKVCGSGCSAGDCTANSITMATMIGTYSVTGDTLTLTFTNSDCSCTSGSSCPQTGTDIEVNGGYVKQ